LAVASQRLADGDPVGGTGVRHLPVKHRGNRTVSREEISLVGDLVRELIGRPWTDARGRTQALRPEDVLAVAPYKLLDNFRNFGTGPALVYERTVSRSVANTAWTLNMVFAVLVTLALNLIAHWVAVSYCHQHR